MRRAGSLFEIDQEPLFEPGSLKDDGASEQGWEGGYDDLPSASASVPRRETDDAGAAMDHRGRRSRVLVVVAVIGVAGFLGSRLTQVAGTPTVASRAAGTSPLPPAAVAPAAASSIPVRRRQVTRPRRAHAEAASRHVRVSRQRRAARPAARARQSGPPMSAPLPVVPAPAPRPAAPLAPEPQGFTGEFF